MCTSDFDQAVKLKEKENHKKRAQINPLLCFFLTFTLNVTHQYFYWHIQPKTKSVED